MKLNPLAMMREEFDNTGIIYDPEANKAMSINATGVTIWQALENGADEEGVVTALEAKFNVEHEVAKRDVAAFLMILKEKGLLSE